MKDIERYWYVSASDEHLKQDTSSNGKRAFFDIMEPHGKQEDWSFQMWNLYYQKLYADYVIARTAAYSNVYYEIINEVERPLEKWSKYWFNYVKESDPYDHLITTSAVYTKLSKSERDLFTEYYKLPQNNIISVHSKINTDECADLTPILWDLNKPIIYDEVFWLREKMPHGDAIHQESYEDEKRWFWGNFVNGSMTVRVCWQSFINTPAFQWIKHFVSFIDGLEWWKMVPGLSELTVESDEGTIKKYECRIGTKNISYFMAPEGGLLKELKIKTNVTINSVKIYNTSTGNWITDSSIVVSNNTAAVSFHEGISDVIFIIE